MTSVLDASAVLAFLLGESGADAVEKAGRDWDLARALLESYAVRVEPVVADDAEWAAGRWRRGEGLSLADRLCLALGERLDADVLTADKSWGHSGRIVQIR